MDLTQLSTENRNSNTMHIDELSSLEMVRLINSEDQKVAQAVAAVSADIAQAVDEITQRFQKGGRIIYMGAGTSGRLGALDAIELTPTYSVSPKRAFGLLAGGKEAMFSAVEGAEDSQKLAVEDLQEVKLTADDCVIAIAASGRTPYAISALQYANEVGALTVSVTCSEKSEMNQIAQVGIAPVVGPEVVTGSTRMKAGTAQKMVLNTISTAVMIQSGKVYQNLMVNVQPTNKKLVQRSLNIIQDATGAAPDLAKEYFEKADHHVSVAIVMIKTGLSASQAGERLAAHGNRIAEVIASVGEKPE